MARNRCTGCQGPIDCYPGDPNLITVYFTCENPQCPFGKLTDDDWSEIRRIQEIIGGEVA